MEETHSIDETPTESYAEVAVDSRPDTAASEQAAAGKEIKMICANYLIMLLLSLSLFPFLFWSKQKRQSRLTMSTVQMTISFFPPALTEAAVKSVTNATQMQTLETLVVSS